MRASLSTTILNSRWQRCAATPPATTNTGPRGGERLRSRPASRGRVRRGSPACRWWRKRLSNCKRRHRLYLRSHASYVKLTKRHPSMCRKRVGTEGSSNLPWTPDQKADHIRNQNGQAGSFAWTKTAEVIFKNSTARQPTRCGIIGHCACPPSGQVWNPVISFCCLC